MQKIPLRGCLIPVNSFLIGERCLCLYIHPNKTSTKYSLYWTGEENPVQHGMTDREVFNILSQELEKVGEKTAIDVQPKHIISTKWKPTRPKIRRIKDGDDEVRHQEITIKPKGIKGIKDPSLKPKK